MIELLRLADSRVAMAGGLATDTLCIGTLVVFSMSPALFAAGHSGSIILLALAITAPVLTSTAVILSFVLAGRFDVEERAKRMLMAAGVLHGGVQLGTMLGVMCGKGPTSWLLPVHVVIDVDSGPESHSNRVGNSTREGSIGDYIRG